MFKPYFSINSRNATVQNFDVYRFFNLFVWFEDLPHPNLITIEQLQFYKLTFGQLNRFEQ